MFINLRARLIPILVLIAGSCSPSAAAADRQWSVTVCGPSADPRQEAVREAVEFWNAKLSSIGAGLKLGPINSCDRVVPDDLLRQMSDGAVTLGRFTPLPAELNGIKGSVIVVLSDADLVSFAESGTATRPGLVVLRRPDIPPLSLPTCHAMWSRTKWDMSLAFRTTTIRSCSCAAGRHRAVRRCSSRRRNDFFR